jgi:RNA recognition motif-containing protein
MKIYIGNLDKEVTEEMVRGLFTAYGEVGKVTIMRDRHEISKGFGFVEMPGAEAASSAVAGLNRTSFRERTLDISPMAPQSGKGGPKVKSRPARSRR